MQTRFGVVPGVAWGTMPPADQTDWGRLSCNQHVMAKDFSDGKYAANVRMVTEDMHRQHAVPAQVAGALAAMAAKNSLQRTSVGNVADNPFQVCLSVNPDQPSSKRTHKLRCMPMNGGRTTIVCAWSHVHAHGGACVHVTVRVAKHTKASSGQKHASLGACSKTRLASVQR